MVLGEACKHCWKLRVKGQEEAEGESRMGGHVSVEVVAMWMRWVRQAI